MGLCQKIRVKRRVATACKVQIFNIAKNKIVSQFHHKIAKVTEGYQIPQSMILNSGHLPQNTSLLGEQQYHPKTQSCCSCWLNRLACKHIQSTLTEKSCSSNRLGWENNAIIIKKLNFLRVSLCIYEKHYSNSGKFIKYLEDIDIPYFNKER